METYPSDIVKGGIRRAAKVIRELEITSGTATAVAVSLVLFVVSAFCNIPADTFSLESSALLNGNVHLLFTYTFFHEDLGRLLLGTGALVLLGGAQEKGLGTVRFLYLLILLPGCAGLLYALLESLLFGIAAHGCVRGLVPAALALQGLAVTQTLMRRALLCGINVPAMALPWVFLIIAHLVPGDVLLCNILAVIMGQMYGKGWFALLNLSESRASILDKKMPFRLLQKLPGVKYMPASLDKRRTMNLPCKPAPGSYPVQAYAPASSSLPTPAVKTPPQMYNGWRHSPYTQADYIPLTVQHGLGAGHSHHNSHWQTMFTNQSSSHWTPEGTCAHSHTSPLPVLPAPPGCCAAPVTVPAGVKTDIPGLPLASLGAHGVHGLSP